MPTDFASFRFSTLDWPERDRLAMCREAIGRTVIRLDVAPLDDGPFHAEATVRAVPELTFGSWAFTNARAARSRALLDGRDDLALAIATGGGGSASQLGRTVTLRPGEAILWSTAETLTTIFPSTRFTSLRVRRSVLAALAPHPEDAVMRTLPRDTEALRLLTRYVRELDDTWRLGSAGLQRAVATHVYDLVALVIGASRDGAVLAGGRGLQAARIRAIKADIGEHLDQSDLSLTAVAARQGLTPRHVQRLFAASGTSFSDYVLGERLIHAHRLLIDPRRRDHTISVIAFEAGFGDLSYFNRTFRRRFGGSPSDVRAAARREEQG